MATIRRAGLQRGDIALWDGLTKTSSRPDATGATITGLTVGDFVDVLQVFGSGIYRTSATIAAAVSKIGTNRVPLVFATGTWAIDSSVTIPANFSCHIPAGCLFSVESGVTLTINGALVADQSQIFTGAGTVRIKGRTIPQWWGAAGDGVTNDSAALQSAADSAQAGGMLYLPCGSYLQGSRLTIADGNPITISGDGPKSIFKKGFNGDMISLGLKSELTGLYLDGNGANFTGRGVIIETGSGGDGYQNIHDMTIFDTASHCIEYTTLGAGFASRIVNCRLGVYNRPAIYAVKYPTGPGSDNGPRILALCQTLGPLCDIGGSAELHITGNIGGGDVGDTVASIAMNSNSLYAVVAGNSFVANTPIAVTGDRHTFGVNMTRAGYTLEAGATNCVMGASQSTTADTDLDNSGSITNSIMSFAHTYTPVITAGGSAFSAGNATITGRWQRFGRTVHLQIDVLFGSTTTFGTGVYTFSLPSGVPTPGGGNSIGTLQVVDASTGIWNQGIAQLPINSGVQCVMDGGTTAVGATNPITFADGDRIRIDITYNL